MKVYDTQHLKNIALVGATKAGKTTLAETMMFEGGVTTRRGSVTEGNTLSDFMPIEQEKGYSVYASLLHTEWRDHKINIIDTPGNDNFIGEVLGAVRAADTLLMVLNAASGVEIGTEILWRSIRPLGKPMLIVLNHIDHEKANFDSALEQARTTFGPAVVPVQYPLNQGTGFNCIIDLLRMVMYKFGADGGKPEKLPIPPEEKAKADEWHNRLVEAAAEGDEKLMELYFEKGSLDEDEMRQGLKAGIIKGTLYPFFVLAAGKNMGSGRLMGFIDNVCPSPDEMPGWHASDGKLYSCNPIGAPSVFVWKTIMESHLGEVSFLKVVTGEISQGIDLVNSRSGNTERFGQIFVADGKKKHPVDKLVAGDLGAVVKLRDSRTSDTFYTKASKIVYDPTVFPPARIQMAVHALNKNEEEKLGEVLNHLQKEDPTITAGFSPEIRQTIISGQGELQLDAVKWIIEHDHKIKIEFMRPRISYRETIQGHAKAEYRHKKQSGGAGQFAEVHILVDPYHEGMADPAELKVRDRELIPLKTGGHLLFLNCIVGGDIDARFIPSVQKGIMKMMEEGPLTGSPVRDVRVALFSGKMHPVDSNDMAFQIASSMAFKEAFKNCKPQLLEPIYEVTVHVPSEAMGDVITDLQNRRGIILGMEAEGALQVLKARVPLAELYKYATTLRSITQGRAVHTQEFVEYALVPESVKDKVMAEMAPVAEAH